MHRDCSSILGYVWPFMWHALNGSSFKTNTRNMSPYDSHVDECAPSYMYSHCKCQQFCETLAIGMFGICTGCFWGWGKTLLWNECVHGHPVPMDLHAPAPHMAGLISSPVGPDLRHEKSRKSSKNGVTKSHACVFFVANNAFLGPAPGKSRNVTESHGKQSCRQKLSWSPG